jgi:hypothetical protein
MQYDLIYYLAKIILSFLLQMCVKLWLMFINSINTFTLKYVTLVYVLSKQLQGSVQFKVVMSKR